MIVKNESKSILCCLESVKPLIDCWVIVDTGSTDGTQQLIQECLKELPGDLYERPWVDFEHNRNEALEYALGRSDYLLFIDADEQLSIDACVEKNRLNQPFYYAKATAQSVDHYRILLIKDDPRWRWEGVLHEALVPPPGLTGRVAQGLEIRCSAQTGGRAQDPDKHLKDAMVLEKALSKDPNNERYAFYLAQSYTHAGNFPKAVEWYAASAALCSNPDVRFWALYCIGHLQHLMGAAAEVVVSSYCRAIEENPLRAEPYERLATYFYEQGKPFLGYLAAYEALDLPPVSPLFSNCHPWVYDYGVLWIFAECAYAIGDKNNATKCYAALASNPRLPIEYKYMLRNALIS